MLDKVKVRGVLKVRVGQGYKYRVRRVESYNFEDLRNNQSQVWRR